MGATWTPGACNNPILCALASDDERALVIAWQTSLEGAIGALGPIMFTTALTILGYDPACNQNPDGEGCDNVALAGFALFMTSSGCRTNGLQRQRWAPSWQGTRFCSLITNQGFVPPPVASKSGVAACRLAQRLF